MKLVFRTLLALLLALAVPLSVVPSCTKSSQQASRYHCPMHPTYLSDKPGSCPICGMRLVPIEAKKVTATSDSARLSDSSHGEARPMASGQLAVHSDEVVEAAGPVPGLAPIDVSPEGLRLAGVRTAVAEKGSIARSIRAVGVVRADETRIRHVHTKISGWVEKLYVNFTGEPVVAGRPILTIFSQELLTAQEEYLQARSAASTMQKSDLAVVREGATGMLAAARRRLALLDVPESLVSDLDRGGAASRTVAVSSPVGGIVMSKNVFEGQQVDPGMELFTVTDLSQVWIEADVYESEISAVHVGLLGKITLASDPGSSMTGKIKYIYPYLNSETRTLRVRFVFPNPGAKLRLESYASVEIPVQTEEGVIIPDSAIMDTGVRQVVFVNTSEGRFEPRLVKVGIRSDGRAQLVAGVRPGEYVATKANFLLDSESRLRAAMALPAEATRGASAAPAQGEPHQ
jgi:RND family efflux transporter MFP subunit